MAQLENQDPTKPLDNFQFLSQIAQFGMVDGIQELQGSFDSISGSLYGNQALQASSLLGREVLSPTNALVLRGDGEPAKGVVTLDEAASSVQIDIRSSSGTLVRSISMNATPAGELQFNWDGTDDSGAPLPVGNYQIAAHTMAEGQATALPVSTLNRIESITVDRSNSEVVLNLSNGDSSKLSEVSEFR